MSQKAIVFGEVTILDYVVMKLESGIHIVNSLSVITRESATLPHLRC